MIEKTSNMIGVLSHRNFRYLWLGQIFSQLALNSLLFVLALVVYQKTASNAAVSGLFLSYGVPAVLFGMVAGAIVDRLDRRVVLMTCDLIRFGLTLLLFFYGSYVGVIYLIMFLSAVINQFYIPAEAPLIPGFVPKSHLVTANSFFSFTYFSSMGLGFIFAGPLIRQFGSQWALLVIALFFLLASLMIFQLPKHGAGIRSLRHIFQYSVVYLVERVLSLLGEGLRYVASSPKVADALFLLTGTQVILAMLGTLGPGFADTVLHIDIRDVSWFVVAPTVLGIITGAVWVGNFGYRWGTSRLIQIGIVGAGVLLMTISAVVSSISVKLLFVLSLFFLLGFFNALLDVPANATLQSQSYGHMRGRVYGILAAAVGGVGILPVVVGGVLADVIGVGKVLFLLGASILLYAFLRMRYNSS